MFSGVVVASGSSGNPSSLSTSVGAGFYDVVVTPLTGAGTGTVTGSWPPAPVTFGYDGNDHATVVDNGATTVTETVSSSGRVLRRVVTRDASAEVVEDVSFGYADAGDSPAYSYPTGSGPGGPVTTWLGTLTHVSGEGGGTSSWALANVHGDILGATDPAGGYVPGPVVDEYGVGAVDGTRLGWLGTHERFTTDSSTGIIRMGARLYQPSLGRFTSTDPIEGGSANNYDYAWGDPVNNLDLDGRWCTAGKSWGFGKGCKSKRDKFKDAFSQAVDFLKPATKTHGVANTALKCLKTKKSNVNSCVFAAVEILVATSAFNGSAFSALIGTLQKVYGCVNGSFDVVSSTLAGKKGKIVQTKKGKKTCPVFVPSK